MEIQAELSPRDRAAIAFADGMLIAQYYHLKPFVEVSNYMNLPFAQEAISSIEAFDRLLTQESWGDCKKASATSLFFVAEKFNTLFDKLFLMKGNSKPDQPLKIRHSFQAYAVALDTTGLWRAGSPANHVPFADTMTHMNRVVQSSTLEGLIGSIREIEGGVWPSSEIMDFVLKKYQPPQCKYEPSGRKLLQVQIVDAERMKFGVQENEERFYLSPFSYEHVEVFK